MAKDPGCFSGIQMLCLAIKNDLNSQNIVTILINIENYRDAFNFDVFKSFRENIPDDFLDLANSLCICGHIAPLNYIQGIIW